MKRRRAETSSPRPRPWPVFSRANRSVTRPARTSSRPSQPRVSWPRPEGTANPGLASGKVELLATAIEVLNRSEPLPFQLDEEVREETRLKYRYIDLRRDVMQQRLRLRHAVTRAMRNYLDHHGFVDIETPMLTKATPEGARDYLVPSRTQAGKFFALGG